MFFQRRRVGVENANRIGAGVSAALGGKAAGLIDELRAVPLGNALEVGAVMTLVDPRQFANNDYFRQPLYRDQVMIADVLLATKADLCDADTLEAYRQKAAGLFPPKSLIAEIQEGAANPAWLDAAVQPKSRYRPAVKSEDQAGWQSQGWTLPPETEFSGEALTAFFDALPDMVSGLVRAKGVFRVLDTWLWLNWTEGRWAANQVAWRRDNRFELIASQIDVARVEAALQACVLPKQ